MPMKKVIGAIVAGFVLVGAGRYLIHSVLLKSGYLQSSDVWRTPEAMLHRLWIAQLANLIFVVAAVLIYIRGVEQNRGSARASVSASYWRWRRRCRNR